MTNRDNCLTRSDVSCAPTNQLPDFGSAPMEALRLKRKIIVSIWTSVRS